VTTLVVEPEAEEELAQAAEWYESRRPGLGVELVAVIDRAMASIVAGPTRYQLWRSDRAYRKFVVSRFPYVIFFRVEGESVVVVAIAHAKRRPGYWVDRR
jgi:plasmid stabilization system protein ParE